MLNSCVCSDCGEQCDITTLQHVVIYQPVHDKYLVTVKGPVCAKHRKYYEDLGYRVKNYTPACGERL